MVVTPHSVGTTEVLVCKRNSNRTSLTLYNNHASAVIYFRFYSGVTSANGFPLRPYTSASFNIPEDDPTQALWVISDTAATPVRTYEGFGK